MSEAGLTIKLTHAQQAIADLRRYGSEIEKRLIVALEKSAIDVQTEARKNVSFFQGRLRGSIAYEMRTNPLRARIGTNLKYAECVERGVRPEKLKHFKTGKVGYFAPIGTTDYGKRWLFEHGFVRGAGKSLGKAKSYTMFGKRTSLRKLKEYGQRSSLKTRRESSPLIPTGITVTGAPRPFLLPALESQRERIVERIKEAIRGGCSV